MAEGEPNIIDITSRLGEKGSDGAPKIQPTTGFAEGPVGAGLKPEGIFSKARRAFSGFFKKIDTNKENKPPLGKFF